MNFNNISMNILDSYNKVSDLEGSFPYMNVPGTFLYTITIMENNLQWPDSVI